MVLQSERQFFRMRFVGRALAVFGWSSRLHVVLNKHAIVQHRHARGTNQFSLFIETWRVKNDVVALPLTGWP